MATGRALQELVALGLSVLEQVSVLAADLVFVLVRVTALAQEFALAAELVLAVVAPAVLQVHSGCLVLPGVVPAAPVIPASLVGALPVLVRLRYRVAGAAPATGVSLMAVVVVSAHDGLHQAPLCA